MSDEAEFTIEGYKRFQVKRKYRKRRKSPIYRKCADLMEKLYTDGFTVYISYAKLRQYVREYCGGFRTTVTDYLGRRRQYYTSPGRKGVMKSDRKVGYLEDFGFVEYDDPKLLILHHDRVEREYHWYQSNIENFSHTFSHGGNVEAGGPIGPIERGRERDRESLREIRESESIPISVLEMDSQATYKDVGNEFPKLTKEERSILKALGDSVEDS